MTPHELIRQTLKKKRWSLREAAEKTGLSHGTIHRIVEGKPIGLKAARALAPIVRRSVAWLVQS